jgi:hypothetical protein
VCALVDDVVGGDRRENADVLTCAFTHSIFPPKCFIICFIVSQAVSVPFRADIYDPFCTAGRQLDGIDPAL